MGKPSFENQGLNLSLADRLTLVTEALGTLALI